MRTDSSAGRTIGRDLELEQLSAVLDGLAAGLAACVTVEGEPGIGKTHLLAALRRRAEEAGCLVLAGSATEFERDLPFSVWVDALDAYVASQELDLGDGWSAELVDELSRDHSVRRPGGDGARASCRRAVPIPPRGAQAARAPGSTRDHSWSCWTISTGATRRRSSCSPGCCSVHPRHRCCSRSAFGAGRAPARLSTALANPTVRRIRLAQLSEAQATELLGEVDPRSGGGHGAAGWREPVLSRAAQARPRGGRRTSRMQAADVDVAGVSAGGGGITCRGAGHHSPADERTLLRAARSRESRSSLIWRARSPSCPRRMCWAALDALLERDLVRPTTVPRRFVFRHPLVRRAVYESAPGGWRLAAHARAADSARRAGRAAASVRIMSSSTRARATSRRSSSSSRPAPRRRRARRRRQPDGTRPPCACSRVGRGTVGRRTDRPRLVAPLARRARAVSRDAPRGDRAVATGRRARRVELTAHCAAVEHWLGRHDEAHRAPERAWDELPEHSTSEAAVLEIELAVDGLYELDFEQSLRMGRHALATARAVGDPALDRRGARPRCASARRSRGASRTPAGTGWRHSTRSPVSRTRSWRRAWRPSSTSPGPRRTWSATTTRSHTPSGGSRSRGPSARAGSSCR